MFWANCFAFCERFHWTISDFLDQPLYGVMRVLDRARETAGERAKPDSEYGDFGPAELRELLARARDGEH